MMKMTKSMRRERNGTVCLLWLSAILFLFMGGCFSTNQQLCREARRTDVRSCVAQLQQADVARKKGAQEFKEQHLAEAEQRLVQALNATKTALGATHSLVADTLVEIAKIHWSNGYSLRSRAYVQEAARIYENCSDLKPENAAEKIIQIDDLVSLNSVDAKRMYERAYRKIAHLMKGKNLEVVSLNTSIGVKYLYRGLLDEAEVHLNESAKIFANDPDVNYRLSLCYIYRELARIMFFRGNHAEQGRFLKLSHEAFLRYAVNIRFAVSDGLISHCFGVIPRSNLLSYNLAFDSIYYNAEIGKIANSLLCIEYLLKKTEDESIRGHIAFLMGELFENEGKYVEAESSYLESIRISNKDGEFPGEDGPRISDVSEGFYRKTKHYINDVGEFAVPLKENILRYGSDGLAYAEFKRQFHRDKLLALARVRVASGKIDQSLSVLRAAANQHEDALRWSGEQNGDDEFGSFLSVAGHFDHELYEMSRTHPDAPSLRELALAMTLLHQGRQAEFYRDVLMTASSSLAEQDREALVRLRSLHEVYAQLAWNTDPSQPAQPDKPAQPDPSLKRILHQIGTLKQSLSARIASRRRSNLLPGVDQIVAHVRDFLPEGAVLVNYVVAKGVHAPGQRRLQTVPPRYLAFVLEKNGRIHLFDLGSSGEIEPIVNALNSKLGAAAPGYGPDARSLYEKLIRPLLPAVQNAKKLFIVADGALNLTPFQVLDSGAGELSDQFLLEFLSTGRDLLRYADPKPAGQIPRVVVFADPSFRADGKEPPAPPASELATSEQLRAVQMLHLRDSFDLGVLPALRGTREEARAIQTAFRDFRVDVYLGDAATENALRSVHSPTVLHLATHGFYAGEQPSVSDVRGFKEVTPQMPANPMLRSFVALASAAFARAPERAESSPDPTPSDGIVTALELSNLPLQNTQLVVLSACNTGQGQTRPGEGVYGLRRAVMVAGAETVVSSLWKVDDAATRDLMGEYYARLLAGEGRAEAMRSASRELRKRYPHPHYWAPFTVVGDGAPLRGFVR